MRRIIQVTETDSGQRIDKLLSQQLPELTRSAIQHLMQDGCVTIGEQPVKKNAKAAAGDVIAVEVPEPKEVSIEPEIFRLILCMKMRISSLLISRRAWLCIRHRAIGAEPWSMR